MNRIDLAFNTVKALNVIARDLGMKRYSKLRKAELINAIVEFTAPKILDMEVEADHAEIVEIMATVELPDSIIAEAEAQIAPVVFSAAPVKAPQMDAPATVEQDEDETTTDDLIMAYQNMRATLHNARGITHAKIAARMRKLSMELRSRKVNMREV